jgi:hypothetical protein
MEIKMINKIFQHFAEKRAVRNQIKEREYRRAVDRLRESEKILDRKIRAADDALDQANELLAELHAEEIRQAQAIKHMARAMQLLYESRTNSRKIESNVIKLRRAV